MSKRLAKTDLGGIRRRAVDVLLSILMSDLVRTEGQRTISLSPTTKRMCPTDQKVRVSYDIATIEREINDRISFLKPGN